MLRDPLYTKPIRLEELTKGPVVKTLEVRCGPQKWRTINRGPLWRGPGPLWIQVVYSFAAIEAFINFPPH